MSVVKFLQYMMLCEGYASKDNSIVKDLPYVVTTTKENIFEQDSKTSGSCNYHKDCTIVESGQYLKSVSNFTV